MSGLIFKERALILTYNLLFPARSYQSAEKDETYVNFHPGFTVVDTRFFLQKNRLHS